MSSSMSVALFAMLALPCAIATTGVVDQVHLPGASTAWTVAVLTVSGLVASRFLSNSKAGMGSTALKLAVLATLAVLAHSYVPHWYHLTPGGRGGQNDLDTARQELLDRYDKFYVNATEWGSDVQPEHDEQNNKDAAERYFTLITDFFEYGWGDAFHMAPLKPGWSFLRSMAEVEKHFGSLVGIKSGSKVADLGMGIGGPMRRLVEFYGATISGVTICQYQVNRAKKITESLPDWMKERVSYFVGDYNQLPENFKPNTYDAAYFMESLSHAEDRTPPLTQARKIVKPGHLVGAWQWMLKPAFNYSDPYHMDLKRGMEYGGGLRNLNKPHERLKEWNDAGLEVLMSYDMGDDYLKRGWVGWWIAVTQGHDIPSMLTSSYYGRRLTMVTVKFLEWVGIAEKGTLRTAMMLEHCGYSAATSGELGIFTPAWVTIGIVPPEDKPVKQGPVASGPEQYAKILDNHPYYLKVPGY
jgi:sterol 24-C-methyltransferase